MRKEKVKSFKEWYDEDSQELSSRKVKQAEYKRTAMRKDTALKRGDIDAYLEDDDEYSW